MTNILKTINDNNDNAMKQYYEHLDKEQEAYESDVKELENLKEAKEAEHQETLRKMCPYCGGRNKASYAYCMQCGGELKKETSDNVGSRESYKYDPRLQSNDIRDGVRDRHKNSYDKNLYKTGYLLLGVCLVLVLGINIAFRVMNILTGGQTTVLTNIGLTAVNGIFIFCIVASASNLLIAHNRKKETGYHEVIKKSEENVAKIDAIEEDIVREKARILYCPYCGTQNRYDASVCANCGGTFDK